MSLGIALKKLRQRKKLAFTQVELAEKMGISRSYISELESGLKYPTIELLKKYSAFFDVKISKIFQISEKESYHY